MPTRPALRITVAMLLLSKDLTHNPGNRSRGYLTPGFIVEIDDDDHPCYTSESLRNHDPFLRENDDRLVHENREAELNSQLDVMPTCVDGRDNLACLELGNQTLEHVLFPRQVVWIVEQFIAI